MSRMATAFQLPEYSSSWSQIDFGGSGRRHMTCTAKDRTKTWVDLTQPGWNKVSIKSARAFESRVACKSSNSFRTTPMTDLHQQIYDLETEIDILSDSAEQCRKSMIVAKAAIGVGALLFVASLLGL